MQTLTTLIDNEVYRRFHRDLVTSRPVDVHHQADQLFKAGGSPERANVPRYNAPPSATLDEVLHNLKAQRKEIDAWKSERQLFPQNVSLPPTKLDKRAIEPAQEFKAQATDENTALEIERLKAALRRYQEADPVADFVHKDILRIAEQRTREADDQKRTVLQERDKLVRDLEATKWHNSNLIAERDGAVAEVKKAKEALGALEITIKEQQEECEKHRRIESALEKQLREFQRRYEALDHHLMELGEQKTAFLEGIRERQSQLDFSVAQLQTTQESLVRAERQRDGALRRLKECEERLDVLNHDLTEARDRLSQLEDDLSKKTKEHQQSEQNLEDARARNTALTTKLTTAEQKNVDQQALLNKLNASLQSATDKFAQFVKEVEAKETSWATVTQKAWDELQRIKAGDVSTSGVSGVSGFPPTPDGAKRVTSQYENLLSQARFREAELKKTVEKASNELGTLKADNDAKQRELQKLAETNKANLSTIQSLQKTLDQLKADVRRLDDLSKTLQRDKETLEKQKAELEKHVKELEEKISHLQSTVDTQGATIKQLEKDLQDQKRNRRIAESGRQIAERKVGDRRSSVGWDPLVKPEGDITKLKQGIEVVKLSYKSRSLFLMKKNAHKPQKRFIKLHSSGKSVGLWRELDPGKRKVDKPDKVIPLDKVLRTEYGVSSTAQAWLANQDRPKLNVLLQTTHTVPWRCFSVYTEDRSYDFICKSDADTEALVLGIGAGVTRGVAIKSRRELLFRRVKMKLQEHCRRRGGITVKQLLLEAIRRCIATTPGLARELADAQLSRGQPTKKPAKAVVASKKEPASDQALKQQKHSSIAKKEKTKQPKKVGKPPEISDATKTPIAKKTSGTEKLAIIKKTSDAAKSAIIKQPSDLTKPPVIKKFSDAKKISAKGQLKKPVAKALEVPKLQPKKG